MWRSSRHGAKAIAPPTTFVKEWRTYNPPEDYSPRAIPPNLEKGAIQGKEVKREAQGEVHNYLANARGTWPFATQGCANFDRLEFRIRTLGFGPFRT